MTKVLSWRRNNIIWHSKPSSDQQPYSHGSCTLLTLERIQSSRTRTQNNYNNNNFITNLTRFSSKHYLLECSSSMFDLSQCNFCRRLCLICYSSEDYILKNLHWIMVFKSLNKLLCLKLLDLRIRMARIASWFTSWHEHTSGYRSRHIDFDFLLHRIVINIPPLSPLTLISSRKVCYDPETKIIVARTIKKQIFSQNAQNFFTNIGLG